MRSKLLAALAACTIAGTSMLGTAMAQQPERTDHEKGMHRDSGGQVRQLSQEEMIFDSNKLSKLEVYNQDNVKLGSLDNLIIDAHAGQVLYGIVDTGLFEKKVPVPWSAVRLERKGEDFFLVVNKSKDDLARAPAFEKDRVHDFAKADFRNRVDQFFGVRTAARPVESEKKMHHEHH